jgi:hypothetical protein
MTPHVAGVGLLVLAPLVAAGLAFRAVSARGSATVCSLVMVLVAVGLSLPFEGNGHEDASEGLSRWFAASPMGLAWLGGLGAWMGCVGWLRGSVHREERVLAWLMLSITAWAWLSVEVWSTLAAIVVMTYLFWVLATITATDDAALSAARSLWTMHSVGDAALVIAAVSAAALLRSEAVVPFVDLERVRTLAAVDSGWVASVALLWWAGSWGRSGQLPLLVQADAWGRLSSGALATGAILVAAAGWRLIDLGTAWWTMSAELVIAWGLLSGLLSAWFALTTRDLRTRIGWLVLTNSSLAIGPWLTGDVGFRAIATVQLIAVWSAAGWLWLTLQATGTEAEASGVTIQINGRTTTFGTVSTWAVPRAQRGGLLLAILMLAGAAPLTVGWWAMLPGTPLPPYVPPAWSTLTVCVALALNACAAASAGQTWWRTPLSAATSRPPAIDLLALLLPLGLTATIARTAWMSMPAEDWLAIPFAAAGLIGVALGWHGASWSPETHARLALACGPLDRLGRFRLGLPVLLRVGANWSVRGIAQLVRATDWWWREVGTRGWPEWSRQLLEATTAPLTKGPQAVPWLALWLGVVAVLAVVVWFAQTGSV